MADRRDLEDLYLETALEENVRGAAPPDLTARITQALDDAQHAAAEPPRGPTWRVLAAAAWLVLGLGVVWAVVSAAQHTQGDAATQQDPDGESDHQSRGEGSSTAVVPKSKAELLELLGAATGVTTRVCAVRIPEHPEIILPVSAKSEPDPETVSLTWNDALAQSLVATLRDDTPLSTGFIKDDLAKPGSIQKALLVHTLHVHLPKQRHLEVHVDFSQPNATKYTVTVDTVGTFWLGDVGRTWEPETTREGMQQLRQRGVVHPVILEQSGWSDGLARATRIRGHALRPADLERIAAFSAMELLDLRFSPAAHDPAGLLHLEDASALEAVWLDDASITTEALGALARAKPGLRELQVMSTSSAYWNMGVYLSRRMAGYVWGLDPTLTPPALTPASSAIAPAALQEALAGFDALEHLTLRGFAMYSDVLGSLARLPLQRLSLSGCLIGRGGFAAFAGHESLRALYLNSVVSLRDDDFADLAAIPGLEELYLDNARHYADTEHDRISHVALEHLAKLRSLRRLHLGDWFSVLPGAPREALSNEWRAALRGLVSTGRLKMLGLTDSPGMTLDDLGFLRHAKGLETLFLNGTVGPDSQRRVGDTIPPVIEIDEAAVFVFEALPDTTIVHGG